MKPFVVIVTNHVKPGFEEEYLNLVMPIIDLMRHETTFINNVVHRALDDPTRFMIYETWADRDDVFNIQIKRDYRRAYETRLPEILRAPREMTFWKPLRADFTFFQRPPANSNQVALLTSLAVRPGFDSEYLELVEPIFDIMRHEPTFISAALARDPDNPARFLIYETWSGKLDLLEGHLNRGSRGALVDRLSAIADAPQTEVWEHLRGDFTFFPPRQASRVAPRSFSHKNRPRPQRQYGARIRIGAVARLCGRESSGRCAGSPKAGRGRGSSVSALRPKR